MRDAIIVLDMTNVPTGTYSAGGDDFDEFAGWSETAENTNRAIESAIESAIDATRPGATLTVGNVPAVVTRDARKASRWVTNGRLGPRKARAHRSTRRVLRTRLGAIVRGDCADSFDPTPPEKATCTAYDIA